MAICLMFHSVGLRRIPWASPQIAEDIDPLRGKLETIRRQGFEVVPFTDPRLFDPKQRDGLACLTFDDGYLDNWVHVQPLLEEYKMPATIFVSTDFIDPRDVLRPQVGDRVSDAAHDAATCCAGFLSWPELKALEAGGLVEIQSHAATHTRWPVAGEIVDYWQPGSATRVAGPIYDLWNLRPAEKPFYLTEAASNERLIPYGTPVLKHEQALVARRFFPEDDELRDILTRAVENEGAVSFFADPIRARARLDALAQPWIDAHGGNIPGRVETDDERDERILDELRRSKQILSRGLGKDIEAICWPEGGVDERTLELAREVGYARFTLPSSWAQARRAGSYEDLVSRISSVPRIRQGLRDLGNPSRHEFGWYLHKNLGSGPHRLLIRLAKAARIARAQVAPFR